MKKGTVIGLGAAVGLGGVAWYLLAPNSFHTVTGSLSQGISGCGGTPQSGIPAAFPANYTGQTLVGGPSPGPAGQHEFPCLWAIAPSTLPTSYLGGPAITRRHGQVWLVIARNLAVSGTVDGQAASALGPWNGIAEYSDGTLVRVYPQPANAFGGSNNTLGAWSGGY